MKTNRHIIKVARKEIRTKILQHQGNDLAELKQIDRERAFLGKLERQELGSIKALVQTAKNRPNANIRVLQVGRGVALKREQLVP